MLETAMVETAQRYVTPDEYLALERPALNKSEWVDGEIRPMPGASRKHNIINVNLTREISTQLRGTNCEIYSNDMRVDARTGALYAYPDVAIACGDIRFDDELFDLLLNPIVIIEVLSPSTEGWDRGEKFERYRRLASLQDYVLVAQDRVHVEHFAREGERWMLAETDDLDGVLTLSSIHCRVALRDIYERALPAE